MASEMRYAEVKRMLEAKGYQFVRIAGSHHKFAKPGSPMVIIPVHHGKVKPVYVRMIEKLES